MSLGKRPEFTEPNLLCVQIRQNDNWLDYATIKTADDLHRACCLVENEPDEYRIVRYQMGLTALYP